jgi:hypothetical protein
VIENYFLEATPDSYNEAKALLDQQYGDSFVIANAFRDKLEKWPKIAVEMRIWCIKISIVLVLHFNPWVEASAGGL